jgi:TolA-binding protein
MKILNLKGLLFLCLPLMVACRNTKEKLQHEIAGKEKILFENKEGHINTKVARETIVLYRYYAEKFPDDTLAADYLFKAGDVSSGISAFDNALEYFQIISEKYPSSGKAAYALFLQGYLNENNKNDTALSRKFYKEFLEKYPNHEMAQSARFSLQHIGKSADEIVKSFQEPEVESPLKK